MEETYDIFLMDGSIEEWYTLRPELLDYQKELISAYYSVRRDAEDGKRVKECDLLKCLECVNYETDIGVLLLKRVDDHYLSKVAEKIKRLNKHDR